MDPTLAIFRIEDIKNDRLQTAASIALLVLGVLYLALIFWTFADARRRIDDPLLVVCATLAPFFPFIGAIVYVIVRPPEFLDDVRLRELEMTAAEARLASLDYSLCPHCDYEVQADYLRCPSCMRKLKERCYSCSKPIDPAWRICPFCEAETSAPTPSSTRRRRRQTTDQSTVAAEAAKPRSRSSKRLRPRARRRVADDADTLPAMEKTLILVKPDAFARGLSGEIIARFERKGLKIVAAKHMIVTEDLAEAALRRAHRAPVLRRVGELHHLRPDHRARLRGRRRDQGRAPGDRRDQPVEATTARSAATSRSPSAPTWSTARIPPSPASAKRGCFSQNWPNARERVSATARDPRAGRNRVRRPRLGRRRADPRRPGRRRRGERAPQGPGSPQPAHAGRGHARGRRRRHPRQAGERGRRRASTSRAWPGARIRSSARSRSSVTRSSRTPRPRSRRSTSARRTRRCWTGTSRRGSGKAERAATPSRAPAPCSWRASRATTFNVVGLPLARLLDLLPELLPT